MSKSTRSAPRKRLTKAEIKAYEARRAAEGKRIIAGPGSEEDGGPAPTASRPRSYAVSRAEEYAVIRADLRRLLIILAILLVVLVAAAFILG